MRARQGTCNLQMTLRLGKGTPMPETGIFSTGYQSLGAEALADPNSAQAASWGSGLQFPGKGEPTLDILLSAPSQEVFTRLLIWKIQLMDFFFFL